jgi:hypothetical protein
MPGPGINAFMFVESCETCSCFTARVARRAQWVRDFNLMHSCSQAEARCGARHTLFFTRLLFKYRAVFKQFHIYRRIAGILRHTLIFWLAIRHCMLVC